MRQENQHARYAQLAYRWGLDVTFDSATPGLRSASPVFAVAISTLYNIKP